MIDLTGDKLTEKKFNKLMKKHKKEFIKMCKKFDVYDWKYMHELIIFIIEWMKDFFCKNPNSISSNEWVEERRKEFDLILKEQEKYIGYDKLATTSSSLAVEHKLIKREKVEGDKYSGGTAIQATVVDESSNKRADMYAECSDIAFEAFYVLLGKCLRNWWD